MQDDKTVSSAIAAIKECVSTDAITGSYAMLGEMVKADRFSVDDILNVLSKIYELENERTKKKSNEVKSVIKVVPLAVMRLFESDNTRLLIEWLRDYMRNEEPTTAQEHAPKQNSPRDNEQTQITTCGNN